MNRLTEEEIFAAAQQMSPAERAAFLDRACQGDLLLRSAVEALLAAHDVPDSFLEAPLGEVTIDQPLLEKPGTVIGPYKLLQQIGEGGFGVVFMAEQVEPVRRKVALKILKAGMDTREVVARFEAERQALAVMDHPNIARVLDAGATESGRPYFVMELVRGTPITQYCDENNLPVRERLELFASVCQAIQHAHTKGIIHRDIKPTNVLVTRQDGQPVVKVIDFGVAKAMGQQLTDKTLFTEFAQMIGTPLYMSPEQAELSSTDIDTRSDIYSLGVLLYELLTGSTPVSKEQLKQAAFDEIRRIIREDEPQKPSTRISTAQAAPGIAAQRHTEPARLAKLVRGELDWIVMKALEKDRSRRYETASGFAKDVQRYLNDEPVLACPPSAAYRFGKFARRNRAVLTTVAVVMAALIAGAAMASWQAVRATNAQNLAQERLENEKKARSEAVANLQKAREAGAKFFGEISENAILDEPGLQPLRQRLLESAVAYYESLIPPSGNDPQVQVDVTVARLRLFQIYHQLYLHDQKMVALEEALNLVEKLVQENPQASELHLRLAGFWHGGRDLGNPKRWDAPEALPTLRRAVACWEDLTQRYPAVIGFQSDLSKFYDIQSNLEEQVGSKDEVLRLRRKVCELREKIVRASPGVYEYVAELAHSYVHLAQALETSDALAAESLFRQAVDLQKDAPNVSSYQEFRARHHKQLGRFLRDRGRPEEALSHWLESIAIEERLAEQFPHLSVYQTRAEQLKRQVQKLPPRLRQQTAVSPADPKRQQALELLKNLHPDDAPAILYAAARLQWQTGQHQLAANNFQNAETSFRTAIALFESLPAESSALEECRDARCMAHLRLGDLLGATNQHHEALSQYLEGIRLNAGLVAEFPDARRYRTRLANRYRDLAQIYVKLERVQEAEEQYRLAIAELEKLVAAALDEPNDRWLLALTHMELAGLLAARQQLQTAEQANRQAVEILSELTAEFPETEKYWYHLGHVHNQLGHWDQAIASYTKTIELKPDHWAAWHNRGLARTGLKQWDEALADQTKAVELQPDYWGVWHARGAVHANLRHWDQVIADETKAVELFPSSGWSWCRRGEAHSALNKWEQAIGDYAKAIELGVTTADVWQSKAAAHASLEQWDNALADYSKATELNVYCLLGAVERFQAAGRRHEAEKLADHALAGAENLAAQSPKPADHWYHVGLAQVPLQRWEQAGACYSKAIELKPDYWQAWYDRGWKNTNLGKWDQAVADFSKAIELKADFGLAWHGRGWAHANLKMWAEALADYTKATELKPDFPDAWQGLGWTHAQLGKWEPAVADFTKAIDLKPDNANAWHGRGWAHANLSQWEKAAADQTKAVEFNPKSWWFWYRRAQAYSALKHWEQAIADYAKATQLGATETDVWILKAAAHAQLHQPDQAIAELRQAAAKGFRDVQQLRTREDLASLRQREDFQNLLAELEEKNK